MASPSFEPRLPIWLSPWLWVAGGIGLGIVILFVFLIGSGHGWWAFLSEPAEQSRPLPNALPAEPGDCRPIQSPLANGHGVARGKICLSADGTWVIGDGVAQGEEAVQGGDPLPAEPAPAGKQGHPAGDVDIPAE